MTEPKIILDLCGGTGAWSKPYANNGYDVRVITAPRYNVLTYTPPDYVYGILAAPPCNSFSRANWAVKRSERDFTVGFSIVKACLNIIWEIQKKGAPLKFWALENPVGYLYNFMGKPSFYFQPWQFGEQGVTATKRTAIWGYFNHPAKTVRKRTIRYINPKPKSKNTEKRNKAWGSANLETRGITPAGFAQAFFIKNK